MSEELLCFFLEGVRLPKIQGMTFCRKPANMAVKRIKIDGTGALRLEFHGVKTCADGFYDFPDQLSRVMQLSL